jgi:hypothetical protein
MPNHCDNETLIYGPEDDIRRFVRTVTDGNTIKIAESLMPTPEALKESSSMALASPEPHPNWAVMVANGEMTQERYDELVAQNKVTYEQQQTLIAEHGYSGWYDWALANWGTKWGDYEHGLQFGDIQMYEDVPHWRFRYTTAWSPFSDYFWHYISQQWPTLTFVTTYEEGGMCFLGGMGAKNGEVLTTDDDWPEMDIDWDDDDSIDTYYDALHVARLKCFDALVAELGLENIKYPGM